MGLSIVLSVFLFVLSTLLRIESMRKFLDRKPLNRVYYAIPFATSLVASAYYFLSDDIGMRTLILSLVLFALTFALAREIYQHAPVKNSLVYNAAAGFILIRGTSLLIRATLFPDLRSDGLLSSGNWHSLHFFFAMISEMGINVFFILMNIHRAESELKTALAEVKTLQGILPICAHCKSIRNDEGTWQVIEKYVHDHSDAKFSHGICPDCMVKHYPEVDLATVDEK